MKIDSILNLIFPPRCILCNEVLDLKNENIFCVFCEPLIEYIGDDTCIRCGKPVISKNTTCIHCKKNSHSFDKNISLFVYDDITSTIIKNFKYKNHPSYSKSLATLMATFYSKNFFESIDFIVPAPVHLKKEKERGFDQSKLLATELSKKINIPAINNLLTRTVYTVPQSMLSAEGRKNNVSNVFKINSKYNIIKKNILLLDDIFTTGSTIDSCSEILKASGANKVYSFCVAIVNETKQNKEI